MAEVSPESGLMMPRAIRNATAKPSKTARTATTCCILMVLEMRSLASEVVFTNESSIPLLSFSVFSTALVVSGVTAL